MNEEFKGLFKYEVTTESFNGLKMFEEGHRKHALFSVVNKPHFKGLCIHGDTEGAVAYRGMQSSTWRCI